MGLGTYLWAAFNARPLGMPLPPNWLGLAAVGLVGFFIHPGLLLVGAGVEIGYLMALTSSRRFRALVDAQQAVPALPDRRAALLTQLDPAALAEHQALEERCRLILSLNRDGEALLAQQDEQLRQLCWLHLRLLAARTAVQTVAETSSDERRTLNKKLAELERRQAQSTAEASPELATSLEGQLTIVRTRLQQFEEARARLAYLDAEIERLRQQAELLREQSLLAAGGTDGSSLSMTIQGLGDSLANTNRWMRDQRLTSDLAWEDAPPLPPSPTSGPGPGIRQREKPSVTN
jgi:hypothetical protein